MKFREIRVRLRREGWRLVARVGSHEQWKHPNRTGRVTIAGKDGADVKFGTLKSISKQAGWQ
jgi:predicted RNA binding protein YcfA (HicA-like mRNA interferase family)